MDSSFEIYILAMFLSENDSKNVVNNDDFKGISLKYNLKNLSAKNFVRNFLVKFQTPGESF